ncbi:MAG: polymerase sigma factor RpoE [Myxococcales bacterium]|nr:polymerase sigma factor RpoE [Myxococcales bacterium]
MILTIYKFVKAMEGSADRRPSTAVDLHAAAEGLAQDREPLDFTRVYEAWFEPCLRWLRALGIPDADLEDVGQDVFLVVRRKLGAFDGERLAAWLYRIASHTASDHRRRAWFRRLWTRGSRIDFDHLPSTAAGPVEQLERREAQRLLDRVLRTMSDKRRVAFALFEIEGYSGEEIAAILDVPVATVWTRLHHARKEFLARVAALGEEGRR